MEKLKNVAHWTDTTINFTHRIAADFLAQVENKIEQGDIKRSELAERLGRSPGRVSQMFNAGNITLQSAVRLARAACMKVALVAYDDGDPENQNGPINSEIFYQCWRQIGSPETFFELAELSEPIEHIGWLHEAGNRGVEIDSKGFQKSAINRAPPIN